LKIGVSVRHIFKPISYLEIQLLSGVSGGYIMGLKHHPNKKGDNLHLFHRSCLCIVPLRFLDG
ncbi:hypothetical protein, partial [Klebsiella pneumoniae]|uniref:hypothetical protein n=1 Tax=Klebsiella pneumoniae TaxID=573 RepID=UPI001C6FCCA1